MAEPLAVDVRPLSPSALADYLEFFDTRAFTDNPRWASCYCYFPYHDPRATEWPKRTAPENRAAITGCIHDGSAQGYLAYAGGKVVGWCNAAPRRCYPMLAGMTDEDPATIGTIFCFIIEPAHRGRGVASALLGGACAGFAAQGLRIVEAKPRKDSTSPQANHFGPLAMYLAAGFSVLREDDDGGVFVRKALG